MTLRITNTSEQHAGWADVWTGKYRTRHVLGPQQEVVTSADEVEAHSPYVTVRRDDDAAVVRADQFAGMRLT